MHADDVIEMYIDDTARLLPRRQRNDVAAELRTLLNEGLNARARESGRAADDALALALVRDLGHPNEVAARYQPARSIIDPADTASFLRAAIIGSIALLLLSVLGKQSAPNAPAGKDLMGLVVLAWIGLLAVVFGFKSWIRRTWPVTAQWKPRDRDRVSRLGTAIVVPIAALCVLLYAAPVRVFDRISRGRFDTSWSAYTTDFQGLRLPLFVGCLTSLLALLSFVAIQGRWRRLTRRINIGLNIILAGVVLQLAMDGNIFESAKVDQIARSVLGLIAVIYVPSVGAQIYGEIGRIDRPAAAKAVRARATTPAGI